MSHASRVAAQLRVAADEDDLDDDTRERARQAAAEFERSLAGEEPDPLANAESHGGYCGFEVPEGYGGDGE